MTRIRIKELVWDEYNVEHIKKHNVSIAEAEEAVKNLKAHKAGKKGRYIAIGRSGTRLISLIVRRVSIGVYYPDGKETQRIGIVPDIEIKPTIAGIRSGRDELLEKAIELINK